MKHLFNTEPFVFQFQKFKIYLDLEMTFYSVNFDEIPHRFIYEEDDLYDKKEEGIPTLHKFQIPDKEDYNSLIDPDVSRFKTGETYADTNKLKEVGFLPNHKIKQ